VFPKIGVPQIIHFDREFHYKPSILGYIPTIFGNTYICPHVPTFSALDGWMGPSLVQIALPGGLLFGLGLDVTLNGSLSKPER